MIRRLPRNMQVLGRITREEMRHVYSWADVYVLPTVSDGFAITQLEAMAHGLPVVVTDRCGEVVEHGKSGFIVPARSGPALAHAVGGLCDDRGLLDRMSQEAWHRARFLADHVFARRFDALLSRVDGIWGALKGANQSRPGAA
jgi:glycosyltransferase involved in cell wall biosynthesis